MQNLIGRSIDTIYTTSGNAVSPLAVGVKLMELWSRFPDVKQYQLVQRGAKEYLFRLKHEGEDGYEEIVTALKSVLGSDAEIKIEYAAGIPVLSSGKFKYVKNEYTSEKKGYVTCNN